MRTGNFVRNGKPQSRAFACSSGRPVKPLQHLGVLVRRDARAIVLDFQIRAQHSAHRAAAAADGDSAAGRGIFDGVVDEIGEQFAQQPVVACGMHGLRLQAQIHSPGCGRVQMQLQRKPAQLLEIDALHGGRVHVARVGARKREQLVCKLRGTARGSAQFFDLIDS